MPRSESSSPHETASETFVLVKGAMVHPLHDQENGYKIREAVYARRIGPANKAGWHWYRLTQPLSLWRDGEHSLAAGDQVLVGPKGAVKKK